MPSQDAAKKSPPKRHQITDAYIRDRPRPPKGNVIDFDAEVKGFAVRFTASDEATFLYCYGSSLAGGSQRRMVIGKWTPSTGKTTASVVRDMRKKAAALRVEVLAGRDPYAEQVAEAEGAKAKREADRAERERLAAEAEAQRRREESELTVDQLCDRYVDEHCASLRPLTRSGAVSRLARHVRPVWGGRKAKAITKSDVKELLTPLRKAGKRAEVIHVLTLVGAVFQFAIDTDDIEGVTENPTVGLRKKWLDMNKDDKVKPRERALTTQREFRAFYLITEPGIYKSKHLAHLPMHPDEAACLRLMMLTGCRPSEAAGMEWEEIDFHARLWNKPENAPGRSKSRRADVVPLVDEAMALLQARRGNGSPFVFPSGRSKRAASGGGPGVLTENRLARAMRRSVRRLERMGVKPFSPHDLRRTVTTGLFDIDVSEYIVKRTLNHSTKGVTDIHYNKSAMLRQRRAALESWVSYLDQKIRGVTPQFASNVLQFAAAGR